MNTTRSVTMAALVSLALVAPVVATEDVVEHQTYEKRTMKIETVPVKPTPPTLPPSRVYEQHDESESTTVERHAVTPPVPVVQERTTKTADTKVEN